MSERLRYTELAPEGITAMRGVEHYLNTTIALPAVLLELVRLRVSLLNGCEFCIGHHTRELEKHHEPQSRILALGNWGPSDAFTQRERHALAWADAVTNIQVGHAAQPEYEAVSEYFEGKDLVDLTLAIAGTNAWNRLSIAFQAEWNPSGVKPAAPVEAPRTSAVPAIENVAPPPSGSSAVAAIALTAPAPGDASAVDVVDDDGGKVAQD